MTEWINPSASYPHLAISREFGVPYGLVLRFSDALSQEGCPPGDRQAIGREMARHYQSAPSDQGEWMTATARALSDLRLLRAVGIKSYLAQHEVRHGR